MKHKTAASIALGLVLVIAAASAVFYQTHSGQTLAAQAEADTACEPARIDNVAEPDAALLHGYDGVALVVSNTANNAMPSLSPQAQAVVARFVEQHAAEGKQPALFSATSPVRPIDYRWIPITDNMTVEGSTARIEANLRNLNAAMATPPSEPGLNTFEAIVVAVDRLRSEGSEKPLVIAIGSGLDDSGPMDTTAGLLNDTPENVAKLIAQTNPSIDLTGVTVLVESLGYVQAPQAVPSGNQRGIIIDTWTAVLTELGATVVVDPAPALTCGIETDQPVRTTALPAIEVITCKQDTIDYELPASVLFAKDTAELRDGVTEMLAEPIGILTDNPGTTAELVGHTASTATPSADRGRGLSEERAQAVADVLIQAGIDPSRITVRGVGDTEPKHEVLNPDGSQNQFAAGERRVDMQIQGVTSCPGGADPGNERSSK